jgi:fructosamine-3-kinase
MSQVQLGENALPMFQAEYLSLALINHVIKGFAPQPMLYGVLDNDRGAYLVMEYVEMSSQHDTIAQASKQYVYHSR